jgi:hypothetical protein
MMYSKLFERVIREANEESQEEAERCIGIVKPPIIPGYCRLEATVVEAPDDGSTMSHGKERKYYKYVPNQSYGKP